MNNEKIVVHFDISYDQGETWQEEERQIVNSVEEAEELINYWRRHNDAYIQEGWSEVY